MFLGLISIETFSQVNDFIIYPNAFSQYNPYFETISDKKINSSNKIKTWTRLYKDMTGLKPVFKYSYDSCYRIAKYESYNDSGFVDYSYENYFFKDSILKKYFNKTYFIEKYLIDSSGNPISMESSIRKSYYFYNANGYLDKIVNYKKGILSDTVIYKIIKSVDRVTISHYNESEIFDYSGNPLEYQFIDKNNQVISNTEYYYKGSRIINKIRSTYNPRQIESSETYIYDSQQRMIETIEIDNGILEIRIYRYNDKKDVVEEEVYHDYLGFNPINGLFVNNYEYY
jgi:hypothetical protein